MHSGASQTKGHQTMFEIQKVTRVPKVRDRGRKPDKWAATVIRKVTEGGPGDYLVMAFPMSDEKADSKANGRSRALKGAIKRADAPAVVSVRRTEYAFPLPEDTPEGAETVTVPARGVYVTLAPPKTETDTEVAAA